MTAEAKRVALPSGVELSYAERGDPTGPALILLPGFGDSWRAYERVLPSLPASVRSIAISLRGHGDSSRPAEGYRSSDFAGDVVALMDALGLPPPVVAGHSSGALLAECVALSEPARVAGLVLLAPPLTLHDHPALRRMFVETVSTLEDPVDPAFVRDFQSGTFVRPLPDGFFETILSETQKLPARVWKRALGGFLEEDFSSRLPEIRVPTLIVWGDQDPIVSRAERDAVGDRISGARLVVYPGSGHSVHWEEPERLAKDLANFVNEVSTERRRGAN